MVKNSLLTDYLSINEFIIVLMNPSTNTCQVVFAPEPKLIILMVRTRLGIFV